MRFRFILAACLFILAIAALPQPSRADASIGISIDLFSPPPVAIAPPPLPVYVVPPPPVYEGYIWAPGHWVWGDYGYFWVPGTWVLPPQPGLLWTPGYWGWSDDGAFNWHAGYWGPHVGFYGGIHYGGGYDGVGFRGGSWRDGHYMVNRSVTNVTNITNVRNVTNVSFNGGPGGITARPTAAQEVAMHEKHIQRTAEQEKHTEMASRSPAFRDANNHGKPEVAATTQPAVFSGHGVVAAREAGRQSPQAEAHNAQIQKNPALAPKGAAVPHSFSHAQQEGKAAPPNMNNRQGPQRAHIPPGQHSVTPVAHPAMAAPAVHRATPAPVAHRTTPAPVAHPMMTAPAVHRATPATHAPIPQANSPMPHRAVPAARQQPVHGTNPHPRQAPARAPHKQEPAHHRETPAGNNNQPGQ